jgi:hypothetical protein
LRKRGSAQAAWSENMDDWRMRLVGEAKSSGDAGPRVDYRAA